MNNDWLTVYFIATAAVFALSFAFTLLTITAKHGILVGSTLGVLGAMLLSAAVAVSWPALIIYSAITSGTALGYIIDEARMALFPLGSTKVQLMAELVDQLNAQVEYLQERARDFEQSHETTAEKIHAIHERISEELDDLREETADESSTLHQSRDA
jgi:hypothetical protein